MPAAAPAAVPIARFVEKPDRATAEQFLGHGPVHLEQRHVPVQGQRDPGRTGAARPGGGERLPRSPGTRPPDLDFLRLEREAFASCPSVALDVAVMERTTRGAVLPLEAGWSDVGSWSALWETADQDPTATCCGAGVISEASRNCYLRSEHRLVVGLGVEDLVVVETDDVVLVAHRDRAQEVKAVVGRLEREGAPRARPTARSTAPGAPTTASPRAALAGETHRGNPGATLSLQMHHHRAEHWIVVQGTARVRWMAGGTLGARTRAPTSPWAPTPLSNPARSRWS